LNYLFQNHCRITQDTISMTHQWQCPPGISWSWQFWGIRDYY